VARVVRRRLAAEMTESSSGDERMDLCAYITSTGHARSRYSLVISVARGTVSGNGNLAGVGSAVSPGD